MGQIRQFIIIQNESREMDRSSLYKSPGNYSFQTNISLNCRSTKKRIVDNKSNISSDLFKIDVIFVS